MAKRELERTARRYYRISRLEGPGYRRIRIKHKGAGFEVFMQGPETATWNGLLRKAMEFGTQEWERRKVKGGGQPYYTLFWSG